MKRTHGATVGGASREYVIWAKMKHRCLNPNNNRFQYYGGRGITICKRWIYNFTNFLADMGPCPDGCSIGRKDNNGNYEPSNCRWETIEQQANNRSSNRYLTARGKTQTISKWVAETGKSEGMIRGRLQRGWTLDDALFMDTKRPDITFGKEFFSKSASSLGYSGCKYYDKTSVQKTRRN